MSTVVTLYSKVFMNEQDDSWCARPSRSLLEWLHRQEEDSGRWIAVLGGMRICLGDPVHDDEHVKELYVPQWILDTVGMEGEGKKLSIRFERSESLAKATKLGFKIIGEIPSYIDTKELLEEPLSQLGVLEEGQILPMPVLEGVHLLVQVCEPTGQPVFLDGAEIALELENDDLSTEEHKQEEPALHAPQPQQMSQEEPMLPTFISPPKKHKGFVPFQGVGYRLCE